MGESFHLLSCVDSVVNRRIIMKICRKFQSRIQFLSADLVLGERTAQKFREFVAPNTANNYGLFCLIDTQKGVYRQASYCIFAQKRLGI
jgi:hypothetical protein